MQHPEISDVAVIGVPDEKWGESLKAFVVLKGDRRSDVGRNGGVLRRADFAHEDSAERSSKSSTQCPRNPTGKVLKTELRQRD